MRWKSHVRFGKRAGETDQLRGWHRAPARLHSRVRFPVIVVLLLLMVFAPIVLASFLANDAAASFDERRRLPGSERGQARTRVCPLGPRQNCLGAR